MEIKKIFNLNMYDGFKYDQCWIIIHYLKKYFKIVFVDNIEDSDIVINGVWSKHITSKNLILPKKFNILWNYENVNIQILDKFNVIFSDLRLNLKNNIRIPLFYYYNFMCVKEPRERTNEEINEIIKKKTDFCCFLISNENGYDMFGTNFNGCNLRNNFFKNLNKIKKVNSGGNALNNINYIIPRNPEDTKKFIEKHKFMICFENSSRDGYITEKIFQTYEYNTVPIYWGHKNNYNILNNKAYIKYDIENEEKIIKNLIRLNTDIQEYRDILKEKLFLGKKQKDILELDLSKYFI